MRITLWRCHQTQLHYIKYMENVLTVDENNDNEIIAGKYIFQELRIILRKIKTYFETNEQFHELQNINNILLQ